MEYIYTKAFVSVQAIIWELFTGSDYKNFKCTHFMFICLGL